MSAIAILSTENIASVVGLYVTVFNSPPWNDGWTSDAADERLRSFVSFPRFRGIAALEQGQPVGLALGWGERWTTGWHFQLKEMCVAEEARRRGVGARLLRALEEHLASDGFERIYLQTGQSAPARVFYESAGFRDLKLVSLGKRVEV